MRMYRISMAMLFLISVCVSRIFSIEVSKDTVRVNDIDFNGCEIIPQKMDTLKLWNTKNAPVNVASFTISIISFHEGLFQTISCNQSDSDSNAPSRIQIALCNDENEATWIRSPIFYYSDNKYRLNVSELSDTEFVSLFNFGGLDTNVISGILVADCFICASMEQFLLNFSAFVNVYFSDESEISFNFLNRYPATIKIRPLYHHHNKRNVRYNGILNIKGQIVHRSFEKYTSGIYIRGEMDTYNGCNSLIIDRSSMYNLK